MIIRNSRRTLDRWLADEALVVLLLSGTDSSKKIHDFMMQRLESWQRCSLIADTAILTSDEENDWGLSDSEHGRYVVLSGETTKTVASAGTSQSLLRPNGEPSVIKIKGELAKGDAL